MSKSVVAHGIQGGFKMKKLVSIALVLAIAVSLVACAGEKPAPEGPGSKGSNSEASGFETMHLTVGGAVNAGSSYTIGLTNRNPIGQGNRRRCESDSRDRL
jgi:hypothetical protein